jgi:hypothetical protein
MRASESFRPLLAQAKIVWEWLPSGHEKTRQLVAPGTHHSILIFSKSHACAHNVKQKGRTDLLRDRAITAPKTSSFSLLL